MNQLATGVIVAVVAVTSPPIALGLLAFWTSQWLIYQVDRMATAAIDHVTRDARPGQRAVLPEPLTVTDAAQWAERALAPYQQDEPPQARA